MRLLQVVMSMLCLALFSGTLPAQYGTVPVPATGKAQPLLSPSRAVALALADADAQAVEDTPFYRYLFLPADADTAANFLLALRLHVNLLSREASLSYPIAVAPGLWRVDFRDYQWSRDVWEKLANIDPYFHRQQVIDYVEIVEVEVEVNNGYGYDGPDGKFIVTEYRKEKEKRKKKIHHKRVKSILYAPQAAAQLASLAVLTDSQAPIVRADWFLVQTARQIDLHNREDTGTGYYDFLQLKSRDDYFRLIGFRQADVDRVGITIRAVIGDSGVSAQNRQIERNQAATGAHWKTLEVFDQSGRGVAINNLRQGELLFNAEEHYAPLPNGLPATYLSDNKGVQQSSVPDKIGGNRSDLNTSNDLRVHVNFSCIQCHTQVLKVVEDDVRPVYTGRLNVLSNSKRVELELRRDYASNLVRVLNRDRQEFQDIYTLPTGKSSAETSKIYSDAFTRYAVARVDLATAARELGVSSLSLRKALDDSATRLGRGDFRLDPYLFGALGSKAEPRSIPRLNFEDAYTDIQDILYGVLKEHP